MTLRSPNTTCRNVTLRSPNTTCRNVTLRSPNTTCRNVTLRSPNTTYRDVTLRSTYLIILVNQDFFRSNPHLNREYLRLKIQQSHHSNPSQLHNYNIQTHNQAYRRLYNTTQYISIAIKSLLGNSINHNLPPPKNCDQASYFSMPLISSSFSLSRSFVPLSFFLLLP